MAHHLLLMERATECAALITKFLSPDLWPPAPIMGVRDKIAGQPMFNPFG